MQYKGTNIEENNPNNRLNDTVIKLNSLVRAVTIIFGILVFQILLQAVFEIILRTWFGTSLGKNETSAFVSAVVYPVYHIVYGITVGLCAWFIYGKFYRTESVSDYAMPLKRVVILVFLGLAMQFLASSVLQMAYLEAADSKVLKFYQELINKLNGKTNPLIYLYTMIFAPFAEEYIFRGLIYGSTRKGFGHIAANIIQALMFALYHGNIVQGIYAFVLGLLLGYAAEHKRGMAELVGLHMAVNISGIVVVPVVMDILSGATNLWVSCIIGITISLVYIMWVIMRGKLNGDRRTI